MFQLFSRTEIFCEHATELDIWLNALQSTHDRKYHESILMFVEKVFAKVLRNPFMYNDIVTELMEEFSCEYEETSSRIDPFEGIKLHLMVFIF